MITNREWFVWVTGMLVTVDGVNSYAMVEMHNGRPFTCAGVRPPEPLPENGMPLLAENTIYTVVQQVVEVCPALHVRVHGSLFILYIGEHPTKYHGLGHTDVWGKFIRDQLTLPASPPIALKGWAYSGVFPPTRKKYVMEGNDGTEYMHIYSRQGGLGISSDWIFGVWHPSITAVNPKISGVAGTLEEAQTLCLQLWDLIK